MSVCAICAGLFDEPESLNAAPCGHIFHSHCLSRWVGDYGSCPKCRRQLTERDLITLFFNVDKNDKQYIDTQEAEAQKVVALENELKEYKTLIQVCQQIDSLKQYNTQEAEAQKVVALENELKEYKRLIQVCQQIDSLMQKGSVLETQLQEAHSSNRVVQASLERKTYLLNRLESEYLILINEVKLQKNVHKVLNGTQSDAKRVFEEIAAECPCDCDKSKNLASRCSEVQRELNSVREETDNLRHRISELEKKCGLNPPKKRKYNNCEGNDN